MQTLGQIIQNARVILQDEDVPYRYSDVQLWNILNSAFAEARRVRPDMFLQVGLRGPFPTYVTTDQNVAFPLEWQFFPAFIDYVVGRAELREDDAANDGRAVALTNRFVSRLITAAA